MTTRQGASSDPRLALLHEQLATPRVIDGIGLAARQAIDDVLDTFRTGRFDIRSPNVSRQEKAFVGVRFEINLTTSLSLARGLRLDCKLDGVEFDIKFSLNRNWMIPREAVNEICLLVSADDKSSVFSAFLGRMSEPLLNLGANQDRKRTLRSTMIKDLIPLGVDARLPENVLLQLPSADREAIFRHRGQEDRFAEFFVRAPGRVVTRNVILNIGRSADSLKRVRAIKPRLAQEDIALLCGSFLNQREWASRLGGPVPGADEWVGIRCKSDAQRSILASIVADLR